MEEPKYQCLECKFKFKLSGIKIQLFWVSPFKISLRCPKCKKSYSFKKILGNNKTKNLNVA